MAKDKSISKEERRAKKAEKLVESAGISKDKKDKKEKKEKKAKLAEAIASHVKSEKTTGADGEVVSDVEVEVEVEMDTTGSRPIGALVPFANPLADDKVAKKVFRGVKKAAAQRTLKRGVKEVVKALRKSQASQSDPVGIVILAADISPMDVISHIPVLCEDHGIPYIYVTSRAELGMAGQTKRPTSVVMISREAAKKTDDSDEWAETYKSLVKVVQKEGSHVKV